MARKSEFNVRPLIEKIKQVPGAMQRELKPLVWQEARLFIKGSSSTPGIIDLTPPGSGGVTGSKARKQGENAVARDIYRVYATVNKAYDAIARTDKAAASAFWLLFKEGNTQDAGEIMRNFSSDTGLASTRSFAKFDGGNLHQRFRNKRGSVTRNRVTVIVTDTRELQSYVKKMQKRVGLLASGWVTAAARLGVKLPEWITRHGGGNGAISVEVGADKLMIIISNKVKYGAANDLQRRVNYVSMYRKNALRRRLPYALRAALKKSGLQVRSMAA